jgi:hypothetical protein
LSRPEIDREKDQMLWPFRWRRENHVSMRTRTSHQGVGGSGRAHGESRRGQLPGAWSIRGRRAESHSRGTNPRFMCSPSRHASQYPHLAPVHWLRPWGLNDSRRRIAGQTFKAIKPSCVLGALLATCSLECR